MEKVILILVDGMRPDAMAKCGNPYFEELKKISSHCLNTKTIIPPVTLPAHVSLFYGVPAERHGITSNVFTPLVRPLPGIYETLKAAGKHNGIFYNWAELRDLSRPGNYDVSFYSNMLDDKTDNEITDVSIKEIRAKNLDFSFVYMGYTDIMGHWHGWMSDEYLQSVNNAINNIKKIVEAFPDYNIIITADHGGHDRTHGLNIPEDMTTPLICIGSKFIKNHIIKEASILDIAPTVCDILEVKPYEEWEGKTLLGK